MARPAGGQVREFTGHLLRRRVVGLLNGNRSGTLDRLPVRRPRAKGRHGLPGVFVNSEMPAPGRSTGWLAFIGPRVSARAMPHSTPDHRARRAAPIEGFA